MYENGSIWIESNYVKGSEHGTCNIYYKNGNIKTVSNYNFGVLEGSYSEYYQDGTIKVKSTYKDNAWVGDRYTFFPDGALDTYSLYKKDGLISMLLSYHRSGKIKNMYRYDDAIGSLTNKLTFTTDGEVLLWTLLHPENRGKTILHLKAKDLKKIV
jgi:antitoxin component YwqK of YwqJK toxin-antitoxin module